MTCEHKNTAVIDSRPYGHPYARSRKITCLHVRRRKCEDCGHKFNTFEMTEEQFAENRLRIRSDVLTIKGQLAAHLLAIEELCANGRADL